MNKTMWRTKIFSKPLKPNEARPQAVDPNFVSWDSDGSAMQAAINEAQGSLGRFLAIQASPKSNQDYFLVKFRLTPDADEPELIWAGDLKWEGEQLWGRLANDPVDDGHVALQLVPIDLCSIVDWRYSENDLIQGDFTRRVLERR